MEEAVSKIKLWAKLKPRLRRYGRWEYSVLLGKPFLLAKNYDPKEQNPKRFLYYLLTVES